MLMTIRGKRERIAELLEEVREISDDILKVQSVTGGELPDELVFFNNTKKVIAFYYGSNLDTSSTIGKELNANLPSHRKHFIKNIKKEL